MELRYSPIRRCVPRLGLETSDPRARGLDSAISTRLDSSRPGQARGLDDRKGRQLISGVARSTEAGSLGVADTAVGGGVRRRNSPVEARK